MSKHAHVKRVREDMERRRRRKLAFARALGLFVEGDPFCVLCGAYRTQHVNSGKKRPQCLFAPTCFELKKP